MGLNGVATETLSMSSRKTRSLYQNNVTAALANSLKAKGFVAVRVETEVKDTK